MTTLQPEADAAAFNARINALAAFVQERCDEDELWAIEASRDDDNPVPDGGVHWQWVASEDDGIVTPDPATTDHVGDDAEGYGRDVSLRSVEEWPVRSSPGRTLPQFAIHTAEEVLPAVGGHIIRHDPARVLAEVAAKRALLAALEDNATANDFDDCGASAAREALDIARRHLASTWSEHPAFKPAWRTEA